MKLFYFLDFWHVKKFGAPVTGDTYYHLERGPIPSAIKNLVDSVESDPEWSILSDTIEIIRSEEETIHKVRCLKEFTEDDREYLSDIEMETLKSVCKKFCDYSTTQIVEVSHGEAPWLKTKELSQIPYTLAADDPDCKVPKEQIILLSQILIC